MPISSMIVKAKPGRAAEARAGLETIPGVAVERIEGDYLAVVTETTTRSQDRQCWDAMERMPAVSKVDLVYHNFEDVEEFST